MEEPKVVLFLPCYNVASTVLTVLSDIKAFEHKFFQIFLVDNGSGDSTRALLERFVGEKRDPKYRLFFNEKNYSLGGSTIIAFREAIGAGADFVICMHTDGQARAADLEHFFPLKTDEDFVVGSRLVEGSRVDDYSFVRLTVNRLFSAVQKWILRDNVADIGAFLAFNLRTVEKIPYERIPANMAYHPSLVLYTSTALGKIKTREFPIHWGKVETSNINPAVYGLQHLWRLMQFSLGTYKLSGQRLEDFATREIASP